VEAYDEEEVVGDASWGVEVARVVLDVAGLAWIHWSSVWLPLEYLQNSLLLLSGVCHL